MLVFAVWGEPPQLKSHALARLSTQNEEAVKSAFNKIGMDKVAITKATEVVIGSLQQSTHEIGVIISPGVPPWAIRAVSTALEEKGFIPLAYLDDKEEVVRV